VGGKCGDDARLRRLFLAGTDTTQPQANMPCAHNNAEAIIILDGHPKGPDTSASQPRQDAAITFNTALSDLHPDHSTTSSLR